MTSHINKIAQKTIEAANLKWNEKTKESLLKNRENYTPTFSLAYKINEEIIKILELCHNHHQKV